jgi:hypothetical protein
MVVAFLPFATSVLAGALRSGHGQRPPSSLRPRVRRHRPYLQRHLALRPPPPPARRNPRPGRRGRHRAPVPPGPGLARRSNPARPARARPGRRGDRGLQRLLLVPDPRRGPRRAILKPAGRGLACFDHAGRSSPIPSLCLRAAVTLRSRP